MPPIKALSSKNEYKIGWITALEKEQAAAIALLDERHAQPLDFLPSENDDNVYNWGYVSSHNVVIVCLPDGEYGLTNATTTIERLRSSLPHIKIGLLVGIGAGIPESGIDIRLGDIAVSRPEATTGGVIQHDFGKEKQDGFGRIGMLDRPPRVLLNALKNLRSEHELQDSEIPIILEKAAQQHPKFALNYRHPGLGKDPFCQRTADTADGKEAEVKRTPRADRNPVIHYGTILSGNKLVKSATARREIFEATGKVGICLEMEAAGLMNNFPCLVIRGICDYADSNKNDDWQRYASATAAAFAKELLLHVPKTEIETAKSITQVLGDLDSRIRTLNDTFTQAEQRADDKKVLEFIQKLYSHAHTERKDRNLRRVDGTCKWFTEHPLFQDWSNGMGSKTLWVSADPGCGKSVLARYLVDEVLSQQDRIVCFFFFKDDFSDQKTSSVAARTILHQLLSIHRTAITASIMKSVNTCGDKIVDSFKELWRIFLQATQNLSEDIVCVFDALDECREEDRADIIEAICGGGSSHGLPSQVKILALSRPYFNIDNSFKRFASVIPILHLSGENDQEREQISAEINLVIKHRINAFCEERHLDQKDHDVLLEGLISVPQKTYTYLWAHLTMFIIENDPGFTIGHTRQLYKQLPPTVDIAYEKILERSTDKPKTKMLLQIIVAAERPFTIREMCILLALDDTQKAGGKLEDYIEPEDRFKHTLRQRCGLFVIIVDGRIYLLHQTAREFLLKKAARDQRQALGDFTMPNTSEIKTIGTTWKQCITLPRSNYILAELCVWFLILRLTDNRNEHLSEPYHYCADYWPKHLRQSDAKSQDQLIDTVYEFLNDSRRCRLWFFKPDPADPFANYVHQLMLPETSQRWETLAYDTSTFSLKMASYLDLRSLVEAHLYGKWKQNWSKETLSEALGHGLRMQSTSAITALIQGGAELNSVFRPAAKNLHSSDPQFPLYIAVKENNIDIVRLLLDHGAEVNSLNVDEEIKDNTPLHASLGDIGSGKTFDVSKEPIKSLDLIMLLISHGADLRIKNSNGNNAWILFYKSDSHGECSQTLRDLLCKEEPNNPDRHEDDRRTALSHVAESGCVACVKDLLKRKASVNFQDRRSKTPLHYALESVRWDTGDHNSKIITELLSAGADVNVRDIDGRTPFHCALEGVGCWTWDHNSKIITELLSAGADVNVRDINGETALSHYVGTSIWDTDFFWLLINAGANIHDVSADGSTYLHMVRTSKGVEELVARGVDINSRNKHNKTPLLSYISNSPRYVSFEVIHTMIRHSADPDAFDNKGNSALMHYCAQHREDDEDKDWKDYRVWTDDEDRKDDEDWKHDKGCEKVCNLLWSGDPVAILRANTDGSTALHLLASSPYCLGCLNFLLKNGAPINAQDSQGYTPLARAVTNRFWKKEVIDSFIRAGADVNLSNENGDTPLLLCNSRDNLIELVGCLLPYRADINAQNINGITLLMKLSMLADLESLGFMLENGADPTIEDKNGRTALFYLEAQFKKEGSPVPEWFRSCIERLGGANDVDIVWEEEYLRNSSLESKNKRQRVSKEGALFKT